MRNGRTLRSGIGNIVHEYNYVLLINHLSCLVWFVLTCFRICSAYLYSLWFFWSLQIINRAAERGEDPLALSGRFCQEFLVDMDDLQCLRPTHQPRVSDHIDQIKEMIAQVCYFSIMLLVCVFSIIITYCLLVLWKLRWPLHTYLYLLLLTWW